MRRTRVGALGGACALLLAASPVHAQLETALDLHYDHDYVWRGLTRVTRPTFQPALTAAWKAPAWLVSAGGWALLEPFDPRTDDVSLAGADALLGELDLWAQAEYRLQILSLVLDAYAGAVRYTFHGEGAGSVGSAANSTELYTGVRLSGLRQLFTVLGLPPELPIGADVMAAFEAGDIGGTYLETALTAELPFFFVGEPVGAARVRLLSGFSWNQEEGAPEGGRYAGEGLTHVALKASLTPYFELGPLPATLHLGGAVQYNVDAATLRRGPAPDDRARWVAWMDVTFSVLYPLRRVP